jgi:hypothetical protein
LNCSIFPGQALVVLIPLLVVHNYRTNEQKEQNMRDASNPEPTRQLARKDDSKPSLEAARRAARATRKAVSAVAQVMDDGVARIDEEIWHACRAAEYLSSLDAVRHARLALSRAGRLIDTGETRPTKDGVSSRVWVKARQ